MQTGSQSDSAIGVAFASEHLDRVLEFFPKADSKVAYLTAISVGMLGILVANLPEANAFDWWCAIAILPAIPLTVVLWNCHKAVSPELRGGTNSFIYFQSISTLAESEFSAGYCKMSEAVALEQLCEQIWRNSKILASKFGFISVAFRSLFVAVPFWILALGVLVVTHQDCKPLLNLAG